MGFPRPSFRPGVETRWLSSPVHAPLACSGRICNPPSLPSIVKIRGLGWAGFPRPAEGPGALPGNGAAQRRSRRAGVVKCRCLNHQFQGQPPWMGGFDTALHRTLSGASVRAGKAPALLNHPRFLSWDTAICPGIHPQANYLETISLSSSLRLTSRGGQPSASTIHA